MGGEATNYNLSAAPEMAFRSVTRCWAHPELYITGHRTKKAGRATADTHSDTSLGSKRLDEDLAATIDDKAVRMELPIAHAID